MRRIVAFITVNVVLLGLYACGCATCADLKFNADSFCHNVYGYGSLSLGFDCHTSDLGCGVVDNGGRCSNRDPAGPVLPGPEPSEPSGEDRGGIGL